MNPRTVLPKFDCAAINTEMPAAAKSVADPSIVDRGQRIFRGGDRKTGTPACNACHGLGVAGAPKVGDAAQWVDRIAQGMDVLKKHAIEGYQGDAGFMPAKGARLDLSDEEVNAAVDYMVAESS